MLKPLAVAMEADQGRGSQVGLSTSEPGFVKAGLRQCGNLKEVLHIVEAEEQSLAGEDLVTALVRCVLGATNKGATTLPRLSLASTG